MSILVTSSQSSATDRTSVAATGRAWQLLLIAGMAFVIMGATDLTLAWYPPSFGSIEWEFAAIAASMNGLALPTLGMFLVLAALLARGRLLAARIVSVVMFVMAFGVVSLAVIYATDVPVTLSAVGENPAVRSTLRKSIVKTVVLQLTYTVMLGYGGFLAWRLPSNR